MFCSDMDASLRELGVGDLAVPRSMRQIGEAFYGRQSVYQAAIAADDQELLIAALARNVYGAGAPLTGAERLAIYVLEAVRCLDAKDEAALNRGEIAFPDAESVVAKQATEQKG